MVCSLYRCRTSTNDDPKPKRLTQVANVTERARRLNEKTRSPRAETSGVESPLQAPPPARGDQRVTARGAGKPEQAGQVERVGCQAATGIGNCCWSLVTRALPAGRKRPTS